MHSGIPGPLGSLMPIVVEKSGSGERSWDIYSRLMKERIIFIGDAINRHTANIIVAQLLYLQFENKNKEISMYINSPGGSVTAGLGIYDTMQFVSSDIATYCIGQAASMGSILLCAGTKGKRFALPNATVMIHQPWGGTSGTASDINIQAQEINRLKKKLQEILAEHSGQPYEQIDKDCDRDFFMTAEMARDYGLVDHVITNANERENEDEE